MYDRTNMKMPKKPNSDDLVNERIRFPEVLVIDENGESLGIKSRIEAIHIAKEKELDLLCVAPSARPAVCKIVNYGKDRFEHQKKAIEIRKNQKIVLLKEVQLSCNIGLHDFNVKLRAGRKFLENGDKVKISIRFRGRQMAYVDKGKEVIDRFIEACSDLANVEKEAALEGRFLMGIIAPKPQKQGGNENENKDEI